MSIYLYIFFDKNEVMNFTKVLLTVHVHCPGEVMVKIVIHR